MRGTVPEINFQFSTSRPISPSDLFCPMPSNATGNAPEWPGGLSVLEESSLVFFHSSWSSWDSLTFVAIWGCFHHQLHNKLWAHANQMYIIYSSPFEAQVSSVFLLVVSRSSIGLPWQSRRNLPVGPRQVSVKIWTSKNYPQSGTTTMLSVRDFGQVEICWREVLARI